MNKRRYYRLDRHFMVSYRILGSDASYEMAQTRDISENGLAILSSKAFKMGEKLQMMVAFPFRLGERVEVTGKVVACVDLTTSKKEYRIGIQFLNIDRSVVTELANYINQFKSKEGS